MVDFSETMWYKFNEFEEYNSYTTQNGKYTISLRNCSEAGLSGSIRLNVYLVHNDNGSIEYIWKKRLDYYDDFTPYIKFAELNNEVIVKFHKIFNQRIRNQINQKESIYEQIIKIDEL